MQTDPIDNATHVPEDKTCTPGKGCGMPTLDYCERIAKAASARLVLV